MTEDIPYIAGFDIGGTKCAVILGIQEENGRLSILGRQQFSTTESSGPEDCLSRMCSCLQELSSSLRIGPSAIRCIGISCGGPLDSGRGVIQSPPNLPGWDDIPATDFIRNRTGIPARLLNDANACALAEWKYGAGQGTRDMIFLTFGTGLGAGIISGGRLLEGHCGLAGECGHFRLRPAGPEGYGKCGSFEGYCSGGGIAAMGRHRAEELLKAGQAPAWCRTRQDIPSISARLLAEAADAGDAEALAIYRTSGARLGEGLALLIDFLNPERIVIGSVFARAEHLLRPSMEASLRREALAASLESCSIVPAALGEQLGDFASLAIAADHQNKSFSSP